MPSEKAARVAREGRPTPNESRLPITSGSHIDHVFSPPEKAALASASWPRAREAPGLTGSSMIGLDAERELESAPEGGSVAADRL